jgi:hypothetical protein
MERTLNLSGLTVRPGVAWGNTRLFPLLRDQPVADLRLGLRTMDAVAVTALPDRTTYTSYVPHGLVMRWSDDGSPCAQVDTQLGARDPVARDGLVVLRHLALREGRNGLRLLPLHLAMEGFLAMQFGGPRIARRFWSRAVREHGLSPRVEGGVLGDRIPGLAEALSLFERHPGQCGMLVFLGDHLASATVVGHPDDYAALHDALVTDLYGSLFAQWGWAFREVPAFAVQLEGTSIAALRGSLQRARDDEARFAREMADGLLGPVVTEDVRKVGRFRLRRFHTGFRRDHIGGEHIGEGLFDADDHVVYLKTYRLDRGQIRRGHLLSQLGACAWDPQQLADREGHGDVRRVVADLEAAGLGWVVADPHRFHD